MDIEKIIELVKSGGIPKGLPEKLKLVKLIEKVAFLETNLIAQIITTARIEDFDDNEPRWQKWVTQEFGYVKERLCHLNLIGKMLLGMRTAYPDIFDRLFNLDADKNLSIARIYRDRSAKTVWEFLRAYSPEKMTRDEVREAVDECLGIKKANRFKIEQPELPGFQQSIVNIYNSLGKVNPSKLIESYDPDTAKKTVSVGMTCLNAVSGYYKKSGEYKSLSVEELNKLEADANKLCKQFGSWREEVAAKHLKAG